jgi:hypothetical protein
MPRCALVLLTAVSLTCSAAADSVQAGTRDLQQVLDAAPPNATVYCDPNREAVLTAPVRISKPVTLWGLNARLPEKLGKTPLLVVAASGVAITNFKLRGNVDSVPQSERAPLIVIAAGDFRIEKGELIDSSKDGLMISGDDAGSDIVGGVIRDLVGRRVTRDLVSIGGSSGSSRFRIRNVLVDNVRAYGSALRGAVEVSDGADNVTVRKVYAEDSVYAVDVQDHGKPGQVNSNVVIEDVYALRCKHALRTANRPLGHSYLTIRDITAKECAESIVISNTDNVTVTNVRVIDHKGPAAPVAVRNANGFTLRDVLIENTAVKTPGVLLHNVDGALIDGVVLRGSTGTLTSAVTYRIDADKAFSGLRISNVFAPGLAAGILLESSGAARLRDRILHGNLAAVRDLISDR